MTSYNLWRRIMHCDFCGHALFDVDEAEYRYEVFTMGAVLVFVCPEGCAKHEAASAAIITLGHDIQLTTGRFAA